jgi:DNA (cytosine-5)-methyltransferase 1
MEKRQNGRRFKEDGEPMFTLTKQDVHGVLITQKKITQTTDIANTLTARNPSTSRGNFTPITAIREGARIRRLTPRECWRLQGVSEGTINQVIAAGISDTQMYRGAGDACTVNVIYEIAKRMS